MLSIPNTDSNSSYLRLCKEFGLERHPARFPVELPAFFIKMLTDESDTVLDIFGGSNTTGFTAEALNRHWLTFELNQDYLSTSIFRFLEGYDSKEIGTLLMQLQSAEATYTLNPTYCSLEPAATVQQRQERVRQPSLLQANDQGEADADFPLQNTVFVYETPTEPIAASD